MGICLPLNAGAVNGERHLGTIELGNKDAVLIKHTLGDGLQHHSRIINILWINTSSYGVQHGKEQLGIVSDCLLYTSPSPRDRG